MRLVRRRNNGILTEFLVNDVAQPIDNARPALLPQLHRPHQKVSAVVPPKWPLALLPLKLIAQPDDRGAGDIIARTIGPIGGDAFKVWYKRIFGKGCGCGKRQESLNQRWPL